MLPEYFSRKSRSLDQKRTKKTSQKAQKNGEKTSFHTQNTDILTPSMFFIAFLCTNIFQNSKIGKYFQKNFESKV